jgi:hypothetical protein
LGKLGFSEVRLPSSRRAKNGASNNNSSSSSAKKAPKDEEAARADKRARVLKKFEDEIDMPSNLDFGSKAPSRAQLRSLVQEVVLAGAKISKRSYSHSHLSSQNSSRGVGEELGDDAIARLKALQKERLIVVRMGFVERANQLDAEIAEWRAKSFVMRYRIMRGDDLIVECDEVRIFAAHREGNNAAQPGIRAVAIPPEIRSLCE